MKLATDLYCISYNQAPTGCVYSIQYYPAMRPASKWRSRSQLHAIADAFSKLRKAQHDEQAN